MAVFLILVGMYGYALFAPSMWTRVVQLVLSILVACALWQKVRDREPYFLDPVSAPPRQLSLADGLFAALAFFVIQGFTFGLAIGLKMKKGPALAMAFFIAGGLVSLFVWLIFRRTPSVLKAPAAAETMPRASSLGMGLAAGLGAGGLGVLYIQAAERIPFLRELDNGGGILREVHGWWVFLLALVAAPLFEEFIFRGLVFRGMRRSMPMWLASVGSAGVFALCHPPVAMIPVCTMGVLAAWVFERSRRLVTPMALHLTYNAVVMLSPVLFFTTACPPGAGSREGASTSDSIFKSKQREPREGEGRLKLVKGGEPRGHLVHFLTHRGGASEKEPRFDLAVPEKLLPEYQAFSSEDERFAWLATRFEDQLQSGDFLSANDLGILHLYGLGVEKDWKAAQGYFVVPVQNKCWVGQRYLAELLLLSADHPGHAKLAAELIVPMIENKRWKGLWAALRARDILTFSASEDERAVAMQLGRLCVEGIVPQLEEPPEDEDDRRQLFERVESVVSSLLKYPTVEDRKLAETLLGRWLAADPYNMEARLLQMRLRVMTARRLRG